MPPTMSGAAIYTAKAALFSHLQYLSRKKWLMMYLKQSQ